MLGSMPWKDSLEDSEDVALQRAFLGTGIGMWFQYMQVIASARQGVMP